METLWPAPSVLPHGKRNASLATYTFLSIHLFSSLMPFWANMLYTKFITFFSKIENKNYFVYNDYKRKFNLVLFCFVCFVLFFVKTKMILEAEAGVGSTPRKFSLAYWSCALLG